ELRLQNVGQQIGAALAHLGIAVSGSVLDRLLRDQAHREQFASGLVAESIGAMAELTHQRRRPLLLLRRRGRLLSARSHWHKQDRTTHQRQKAQAATHECPLLAGTISAGDGSLLAPSLPLSARRLRVARENRPDVSPQKKPTTKLPFSPSVVVIVYSMT